MSEINEILQINSLKSVEKALRIVPKTTKGQALMGNLIERLERRGRASVEMDGLKVSRVKINLASNFFNKTERNFEVWVRPFIMKNKLMFNWQGTEHHFSDVFGDGINRVKL